MRDAHEALAAIGTLSEALVGAAAAGDWAEVNALDELRYELLSALPEALFTSGDPALQSVLEQALAVTQTVLEQARDAQSREAGALRELHRAHRGARAYLNVG